MEITAISPGAKKKCKALLKLFQIDGKPADQAATDGQIEIFHAIISKRYPRVEIISSTQYGKSLFVALACIFLAYVDRHPAPSLPPPALPPHIIIPYHIHH